MTEYNIKAETFLRLATCALQPGETTNNKHGDALRSVRIEQKGGVAIAIGSIGKILAGECLPDCGEDGMINVTIEPDFINLVYEEAKQDGVINIAQMPGWTIARTIVTEKMYPKNAELPGDWSEWRNFVPKATPTKNNGAFCFDGELIRRLAGSSPSGAFVLPKFCDKDMPVIVRDKISPHWFGMFLVTDPIKKQEFGPAEVPEWL